MANTNLPVKNNFQSSEPSATTPKDGSSWSGGTNDWYVDENGHLTANGWDGGTSTNKAGSSAATSDRYKSRGR